MRKLNVEDSFAFSEILDKMEVQDDINKLLDTAKGKGADAQSWLGGQLVLLLVKRLHKARNEVIALLASLFGKSVDEIKSAGIAELKDMIEQIFKSEDFAGFFR